jgi:hypothetical protein
MDFPVKELQKIFGNTPINLNSKAITFENKRTQTILIIAGLTLFTIGTAIYFYKKGKKRSEQECMLLQKKLKEIEAMKFESERLPSLEEKKA